MGSLEGTTSSDVFGTVMLVVAGVTSTSVAFTVVLTGESCSGCFTVTAGAGGVTTVGFVICLAGAVETGFAGCFTVTLVVVLVGAAVDLQ